MNHASLRTQPTEPFFGLISAATCTLLKCFTLLQVTTDLGKDQSLKAQSILQMLDFVSLPIKTSLLHTHFTNERFDRVLYRCQTRLLFSSQQNNTMCRFTGTDIWVVARAPTGLSTWALLLGLPLYPERLIRRITILKDT